jgi:nucleoside-diphosphate-sugar epimerase
MILVTGANGFVGSYICRQLLSSGKPVKALVRENADLRRISDILDQMSICTSDLLDLPLLDTHFNDIGHVIHCGARISFHSSDCEELMAVNVEGTRNIVNLCLKHGVKKLVHISSTAAIGRTGPADILDEETPWNETKLTSCYGKSKYLAELEIWRGQTEGQNVAGLNPSVILGQKTLGKGSGQLLEYARHEHRFYPTGDLNYVDVRDVANIAVRLLDEEHNGKKFIVNAGAVSYKKFFTEVAELVGIRPPEIAAEGWKLRIAIWGDFLRSLFTGKRRNLSTEMVRSTAAKPVFKNTRAVKELNYSFIPLAESLKWVYAEDSAIEKS